MDKPDCVDFEDILRGLEPLSRDEIAEQVICCVSQEDGVAFGVLVAGLSLDALRVVSARALYRLRRASLP